jgi:MOSC domain-containing protein YiiM
MIKGTVKELFIKPLQGNPPVKYNSFTLIRNTGIENDCFAQGGNRQISIVLSKALEEMRHLSSERPCLIRFTYNMEIDADAMDLAAGARLKIGNAVIEITQIGKKCHNLCESVDEGCPLIRGCIFARVITGGTVSAGDEVEIC